MRPKVVMHTQISLDGCVRGFTDTGVYYSVANCFHSDTVLFGSETVFTAAEQYPPETEKAFEKPFYDSEDTRPIWVIPDSRGRLRNLHVFRDSAYCKDIIVLISEATPLSYQEFLKERNYDFILTGKDHVDYGKALEILYVQYDCRVIRTDSGGGLTNILIEQGLIDEISIVISPCLVGCGEPHLFRGLSLLNRVELKKRSIEIVDGDYLSIIYEVLKSE